MRISLTEISHFQIVNLRKRYNHSTSLVKEKREEHEKEEIGRKCVPVAKVSNNNVQQRHRP